MAVTAAGFLLLPAASGADGPKPVTGETFQNAAARTALDRLEHSTDVFKGTLSQALDSSVLNGTALEDRLNQWANLLEDEVETAGKEFDRAAKPGKGAETRAGERFATHWGNSMMAATAVNRAMLRRGFAPRAEAEWRGIRTDLNIVARAIGRPALPDMTAVMFRPAPAYVMSEPDVKQTIEELKTSSDRFEDKLEHAWFAAMAPKQRRVVQRWADDLKTATEQALDEYRDKDAQQFEFKLEECLMLAAGLNRTLAVTPVSGGPFVEWDRLRDRLNLLAARFGYPVVPVRLSA